MRGLVHLAWMGGLGCLLAGCLATPLRPALPIDGTDSQGQALSLAEYRGKIVLLDFWRFG